MGLFLVPLPTKEGLVVGFLLVILVVNYRFFGIIPILL